MEPQMLSPQETYRRIGLPSDLISKDVHPDTTAIILNWSRFPNVKRIATLLCSPILDPVIAEVFIWNNSPNKVTYDDFRDAGCRTEKLRLYNSSENLYFQARFMACEHVRTPYCFIQDDDYLVIPEVIHTLHAAIVNSPFPHTIHLLPAHEHLSTSLRELHVAATVPGAAPAFAVHTGFAWLGHGAMLHRSEAVDFMKLMRLLNTSEDEMKMADNYYTILGNRVPEAWFDQGIELGGGQAFTVGTEGEERNNRHIVRAGQYLTSIAAGEIAGSANASGGLPYVAREHRGFDTAVFRAACCEVRCLLETNIALLPQGLKQGGASACDMLSNDAFNRNALGAAGTQHYVEHPPSRAVDDRLETFFLSPQNARAGDFIALDFFEDICATKPWRSVEMVWVVDAPTERVLQTCVAECSLDGVAWSPLAYRFVAQGVSLDGKERALPDSADPTLILRECVLKFLHNTDATRSAVREVSGGLRYVRIVSTQDQTTAWRVHRVYMRGQI